MWVVEGDASSEYEPPFCFIHLVFVLKEVYTEQEGEEELPEGEGSRGEKGEGGRDS